ncbi:MAG: hypothetical protein VKJ04_02695 [Vampirovibrionales bacterium]|nr:hypothetical protein [Vampirovibrionales bacterium]
MTKKTRLGWLWDKLLKSSLWRIDWLPLGVLMMLSAFCYTQGLFDHSLNWDEANTLAMAKLAIPEMFYVSAIRDINLAGGSLIQHLWGLVFGTSNESIRFLSALAGILAIAGAYAIAHVLTRSRSLAFLTGLMVMGSPLLARFARLSTKHVFYCAEVFWSYALFFRLLDGLNEPGCAWTKCFRMPSFWLYALVSEIAVVTEPVGPVFLLGQALYGALVWKSLEKPARLVMCGLLLLLGISFLPQVWLFLQPWHAGHMKEMADIHGLVQWQTLLFMPVNLLLWGRDRLSLPPLPILVVYGLSALGLLVPSFYRLYRKDRRLLCIAFVIGVAPLMVAFLLAVLSGKALFQYRALMFGMIGLMLPVAWWVNSLKSDGWRLWWLPVCVVLLLQWVSWRQLAPTTFLGTDYAVMAADIRSKFQPGDGIVLAPGYLHLGFYRYFEPSRFGLTDEERRANPRRENIHHMVQGIDQDAFLVSGEDYLTAPAVIEAFKRFQAAHKRVWLLVAEEYLPYVEPHMACGTINMLQGPGGRFWQVRCPFRHPAHCQRPLPVAAVSSGWTCPNRKTP